MNRCDGGCAGEGMPGTQQAFHHLQHPSASLRHPEVGADGEWIPRQ